MANYPNAISKVVLDGSRGTWRAVYYNPRNKHQVAVISTYCYEREGNLERWTDYKVSVPIEGRGGWHIELRTLKQARSVANLECTKGGKLLNRLVVIPLAFLGGKLS
jgi:hypothetical protein